MSTGASEDVDSRTGFLDGSTVMRSLRHGASGSAVVSRLRDLAPNQVNAPALPDRWQEASSTVSAVETFERAAGHSGLARGVSEGSVWVRSSFLYRWLTAEPEPEVIVIDLRDTFTVRPFIVALDEALQVVGLGLPTSTVHDVLARIEGAVRAAPVRIASGLLLGAILASLGLLLVTGSASTASFALGIVGLGLTVLGLRVEMTWAELRDSRLATLLVALLEPPEPPERREEHAENPEDDERDSE